MQNFNRTQILNPLKAPNRGQPLPIASGLLAIVLNPQRRKLLLIMKDLFFVELIDFKIVKVKVKVKVPKSTQSGET